MSTDIYTELQSGHSFTSREVPWLKIGKVTDTSLSVRDAIVAGGMDFTVSKRPLQYRAGDGSWKASTKRYMLTRDGNDDEFEVVSDDYVPVQYVEALSFIEHADPVVAAAGTLRGGRQGFIVVELPGLNQINGLAANDPHQLFGIVRTGHDRTKAVEYAVMTLRDRCMNMLALKSLTRGAPQRWSFTHTGDVKKRLVEAQQSVERTAKYAQAYARQVDQLMHTPTPIDSGRRILTSVIKDAPRKDDVIEAIMNLWQHDQTVGFASEGWGLVNAVSSYMQWERSGGTPESRFIGAMTGSTYQRVNRVTDRVLEAAKH